MNSSLDVALIQLRILGVMIQCEDFQKKHPRYPSGAVVDGKPVGGQFMPKDSPFSREEVDQKPASDRLVEKNKNDLLAEEIAFASTKEQVHEVLARRLAYTIDEERLPKATNAFLKKHKIKHLGTIRNKETGFSAVLLQQGKTSFVDFVGTNPRSLKDLKSDAGPEIGRDQFEANRSDILEFIKKEKERGQKVTLIGHSLGGALAQITASEFPFIVDEVEVYNPPGITVSTQKKFIESNRNIPVTIHIHGRDPVSRAGKKLIPGQIKYYKTTKPGGKDPHRGFLTSSTHTEQFPTPKWLQKRIE
jgi:hypothetical protein